MKKDNYRDVIKTYIEGLDDSTFLKSLKEDLEQPLENLNDGQLNQLFETAIKYAQDIKKGRLQEENELVCFLMLMMFFEK